MAPPIASLYINGIFPLPTQQSGPELLLLRQGKAKLFPNQPQTGTNTGSKPLRCPCLNFVVSPGIYNDLPSRSSHSSHPGVNPIPDGKPFRSRGFVVIYQGEDKPQQSQKNILIIPPFPSAFTKLIFELLAVRLQ